VTESGASAPVGSVAEEALKLIRALNKQAPTHGEPGASHVCEVGWCPVCQVVGFVRENPDVVAQFSQSAAMLKQSLQDIIDAALGPRQDV